MGDVLQIIGSILLLIAGVAIIVYVLFRKSPAKEETPADNVPDDAVEGDAEEGGDEETSEDDIPEGEAPAEIERED